MPGTANLEIQYYVRELLWRPVGCVVKFVFVKHPIRGNSVCMSTDLTLDALDVIRIYSMRFKIEVMFKQAVHQIGAFMYHFWMKKIVPTKRRSKGKIIQFAPKDFKEKFLEKIRAYHIFMQVGFIAQGLMQYLSLYHPKLVWSNFGSWLRTIRCDVPPSEKIVAISLKSTFVEFLLDERIAVILKKFLFNKIDLSILTDSKIIKSQVSQ